MSAADQRLDCVIISGDIPMEVLGKEIRRQVWLTVEGVPATLGVLDEYFRNGRDAQRAKQAVLGRGAPFVGLNGPYLVQYLARHGFHAEEVRLFGLEQARLRDLLARRPRAVVISTTFLPFAKQIDALAAAVKQLAPGIPVIAGGVQVWKSYLHRQLRDRGELTPDILPHVAEHNYLIDDRRPSPVDVFVVSKRGEGTLVELLNALRDGKDYRQLDNTAHYANGQWTLNHVAEAGYEEVSVDWGRVDVGDTRTYLPVQAGLGCGYQCTFCDFRGLYPKVNLRSVQSIVEELRTIPLIDGVRRAYFTDDNLFVSKRRAIELCDALIKGNLNLRWRGMFRLSVVDEEVAEYMARSGCVEVLLGVESGDAEILAAMTKRTKPGEILRAVEALTKYGVSTKNMLIVGFPGETEQSVRNTVDILNQYPTDGPAVHRVMFFTFAVLPLAEIASPANRALHQLRGYGYHWKHATMDSSRAEELMAWAQDALKPELSPPYVLEVPEYPGLSMEQVKRVYRLRNLLVRAQRSQTNGRTEPELWQELDGCFANPTTGARPADLIPQFAA
jgi:p-methyltransferase